MNTAESAHIARRTMPELYAHAFLDTNTHYAEIATRSVCK
nr:MAG TPA: hypothetical protein [Bacteriophage sp.]